MKPPHRTALIVAAIIVLVLACVYLFTQNRELQTKAAQYQAIAEDAESRAKTHENEADAYREQTEALAADLEHQINETNKIQRKYDNIKGRYDRHDSDQLQRELAGKLN